jgi:N-dimethylarginine dimethylaminohydrolase
MTLIEPVADRPRRTSMPSGQAMSRSDRPPHFLMCAPEHFAVVYAINPWMEPKGWARNDRELGAAARDEWQRLHRTLLALGASIELIPPVLGLPDLVFTANAAVVLNGLALLSRFRHQERSGEEPHFEAVFAKLRANGLIDALTKLPRGVVLEGAGDCVFDESRNLFWLGYGQRSDAAAASLIAETFATEVVALELTDPRFYHMDTALCPLPNGEVMYVPGAFTRAGQASIRERVAPADRIEITIEDASRLAANAVALGRALVLAGCSRRLGDELTERGYRVIATPLSAFLRSGGAAFCLTLRLDRRPRPTLATAAA